MQGEDISDCIAITYHLYPPIVTNLAMVINYSSHACLVGWQVLQACPGNGTNAGSSSTFPQRCARPSVARSVRSAVSFPLQAKKDLLHPAQIPRAFSSRLAPAVLELNHLCNALPGRAPA